jgi:hypothetical protein
MDLRQDEFKYLAIKNWHKFQGGRMRDENRPRAWIKNYLDKESDHDYSKLTCFQRYVLDACQRLRGRLGKNLPNDPVYIARAVCIVAEERHCLPQALRKLVLSGFLILSNQQTDTQRGEERRGEEREITTARERAQNSPRKNGVATNFPDPAASSPDGSKPDQNRPSDDPPAPDDPQPPEPDRRVLEAPRHQETPLEGLTAHQLARGMMETLGIAGGQSDLGIWSQAIALKARRSGMSLPEAYQFILAKAEAAQELGEFTKPTFWMKDAVFDHKPHRSKSNAATQEFADRFQRELAIGRRSL